MQKTRESNCSHRARERGQANAPQGEQTRGESRGVEVTAAPGSRDNASGYFWTGKYCSTSQLDHAAAESPGLAWKDQASYSPEPPACSAQSVC